MARRPRRMREDDPQEQDGPVPPLGPPAAMVTELLELRRRVELLRGAITIAGKIVARFASLACSILVRLANSGLVQMDPESARAWQVLPVRGACEAVAS